MATNYADIFDSSFQNRIDLYNAPAVPVDDEWEEDQYFDEVLYLKQRQENQHWSNFDKRIFAIFWQLELSDIQLPNEMYDELIKKKQTEIDALTSSQMNQA